MGLPNKTTKGTLLCNNCLDYIKCVICDKNIEVALGGERIPILPEEYTRRRQLAAMCTEHTEKYEFCFSCRHNGYASIFEEFSKKSTTEEAKKEIKELIVCGIMPAYMEAKKRPPSKNRVPFY